MPAAPEYQPPVLPRQPAKNNPIALKMLTTMSHAVHAAPPEHGRKMSDTGKQ